MKTPEKWTHGKSFGIHFPLNFCYSCLIVLKIGIFASLLGRHSQNPPKNDIFENKAKMSVGPWPNLKKKVGFVKTKMLPGTIQAVLRFCFYVHKNIRPGNMKSHVCEEIQGPAILLSLHWPAVEQAQEKK